MRNLSIEAMALASRGLAVFPCSGNKRPACPDGLHNAATDPQAVRKLFGAFPSARLIGVATGEVSGIDVLDLDTKPAVRASVRSWWDMNRDAIPPTRTHRTRSGGLHLLFRHAAGQRNTASRLAPGVDTRGDGGYIIWWPMAGLPVLACQDEVADWPQWILSDLATTTTAAEIPPAPKLDTTGADEARRYAVAALQRAADDVRRAGEGMRNHTLNRQAWCLVRLIDRGISRSEIVGTLAAAAGEAGLREPEISKTIASALRSRAAA
jgi:Bifunctional DNA primase/polymerase, N-terminal